ncbi:MAG: hypothetical protein GY696_37620 [Gammaproteobacteria bacterium]|nr:hypothetical protein [Gammaproteobacteria bacterium]
MLEIGRGFADRFLLSKFYLPITLTSIFLVQEIEPYVIPICISPFPVLKGRLWDCQLRHTQLRPHKRVMVFNWRAHTDLRVQSDGRGEHLIYTVAFMCGIRDKLLKTEGGEKISESVDKFGTKCVSIYKFEIAMHPLGRQKTWKK